MPRKGGLLSDDRVQTILELLSASWQERNHKGCRDLCSSLKSLFTALDERDKSVPDEKKVCPTCNGTRMTRSPRSGYDIPCPTCCVDSAAAECEKPTNFTEVVRAMRDEAGKVAFTPGLPSNTICVHGNPPWECQQCYHVHAKIVDGKPMPDEKKADSKRFRLKQIGVRNINVDSEPSKSVEGDDWIDIVITVQDRAGNLFEVTRVVCKYDGMIGESRSDARLVQTVSWDNALGDKLICPLCHMLGHGAGACNRR